MRDGFHEALHRTGLTGGEHPDDDASERCKSNSFPRAFVCEVIGGLGDNAIPVLHDISRVNKLVPNRSHRGANARGRIFPPTAADDASDVFGCLASSLASVRPAPGDCVAVVAPAASWPLADEVEGLIELMLGAPGLLMTSDICLSSRFAHALGREQTPCPRIATMLQAWQAICARNLSYSERTDIESVWNTLANLRRSRTHPRSRADVGRRSGAVWRRRRERVSCATTCIDRCLVPCALDCTPVVGAQRFVALP
jgi:hypothetical protein